MVHQCKRVPLLPIAQRGPIGRSMSTVINLTSILADKKKHEFSSSHALVQSGLPS